MTDNEKASTFIGWSLDMKCAADCRLGSHLYGYESIHDGDHLPPNLIPAPDMSRPENYMRALDNLTADGWLWYISNHADKSVQTGIWRPDQHAVKLSPRTDVWRSVVGTLAALYDAEHSKCSISESSK